MDLGLNGKVAWVLGGSSGLGRASAARLASEGASVAISARNRDSLEAAASDIDSNGDGSCVAVPLDVTDAAAIPAAARDIVHRLGPIDILVVNAGGPPAGRFLDFTDDDLLGAVELTLASAWRLCDQVVPAMRERKSGCIVFITSSSTKEVISGLLLSNTVRAAVVGLAKTLSRELGPHGIRVLCAAPGAFETPRSRSLAEATAKATSRTPEEVTAEAAAAVPLGRIGKAAEFGDVVAFLASERASYLTGVTVLIDGGRSTSVLA